MAHLVRSIARTLAIIGSLAALTVSTRAAFAQDVARYDAIIATYVRGDADVAVRELARWPRTEVIAAVNEWTRRSGVNPRQAIMLHTDLAYVLMIAGASATPPFHLAIAHSMVVPLARRERDGRSDGLSRNAGTSSSPASTRPTAW